MRRTTPVLAAILLVAFAVTAAGVATAHVTGTTEQAPDEADVTLVEESLALEAGPGQAIHGETDLDVGREVTVRVSVADGPAFDHERTATVTHTGGFHTVLDLSVLAANTTVELTIERDGEVLAAETTTVEACDRACESDSQEPAVELDDRDEFEGGPGRTIAGNTSLPADAEVELILEQGSTLIRETANVTADGTFQTVVHLDPLDPGESATVVARWIGASVVETEEELTVRPCETSCELPAVEEEREPRTQFVREFDEPVDFGETVLVPVDVHEQDTARVEISGGARFDATVTVEDGTGNGRVTIAFNTRPEGGEPLMFATDTEDRVAVEELGGAIGPDSLRLTLHHEDDLLDSVRLELEAPAEPHSGGHDPTPDGASDDDPGSGPPLASLALFVLASVCAATGLGLLTGVLDP